MYIHTRHSVARKTSTSSSTGKEEYLRPFVHMRLDWIVKSADQCLVNRIPKKYDTSCTTNPQQIEVPVMEFEISTRGYPRVDTYPKLMPIYLTYVNNVYSLSRSRQASMIGLRVSWTAKKTNDWVLNKAGVKMELLDAVKARKLTN